MHSGTSLGPWLIMSKLLLACFNREPVYGVVSLRGQLMLAEKFILTDSLNYKVTIIS